MVIIWLLTLIGIVALEVMTKSNDRRLVMESIDLSEEQKESNDSLEEEDVQLEIAFLSILDSGFGFREEKINGNLFDTDFWNFGFSGTEAPPPRHQLFF